MSQEVFPVFPVFSSYFPACYLIVLCFQQVLLLPSDWACLQSPERSWTFQNFAYFGIIVDIQFYTLQLVYSLLK